MKKITHQKIADIFKQDVSILSHLKKRNPNKYEVIKLGSYLFLENIKEDEIFNLLETYRNMKNQVNTF